MPGETILHYKILEEIERGGMGEEYKAEDTKLKREVAIKYLPHQIAANDEDQKRFEIEAQAAASLNHSNNITAGKNGMGSRTILQHKNQMLIFLIKFCIVSSGVKGKIGSY